MRAVARFQPIAVRTPVLHCSNVGRAGENLTPQRAAASAMRFLHVFSRIRAASPCNV